MKDVIDAIARLETKVDSLRDGKTDHETRIRSLEKWRWLVVGGAGVCAVALKFLTQ